MSDRTAEQIFRAEDSQDYSQQVNVRPDAEKETSRSSDSNEPIQESDNEEAIATSSDSDEETQGADVDEKLVRTPIVVISDDEEEAGSKREAVMAWVESQEVETQEADPNPNVHSIFDYPWLRSPTDQAWRPWEDQYLIDSTLRGTPHKVTASYLSERQVMRSETDCSHRVRFHTHISEMLPKCWTEDGGNISLKDLGEDELDELALFKWNKAGLEPRVFRDERTACGLRDCLIEMDALDGEVLRSAVKKIMKKRAQRKRDAKK